MTPIALIFDKHLRVKIYENGKIAKHHSKNMIFVSSIYINYLSPQP